VTTSAWIVASKLDRINQPVISAPIIAANTATLIITVLTLIVFGTFCGRSPSTFLDI